MQQEQWILGVTTTFLYGGALVHDTSAFDLAIGSPRSWPTMLRFPNPLRPVRKGAPAPADLDFTIAGLSAGLEIEIGASAINNGARERDE